MLFCIQTLLWLITDSIESDWTSLFYQLSLTFLYLHLLVTSSAGGKSLVRPRPIKHKPNICIVFVPELQDIYKEKTQECPDLYDPMFIHILRLLDHKNKPN